MYPRLLNPLKTQSFFLFGARGTGKSTLLRGLFSGEEAMVVDLLEPLTLGQLQSNPASLVQMLPADPRPWCVID
jgi:hypothetical protein